MPLNQKLVLILFFELIAGGLPRLGRAQVCDPNKFRQAASEAVRAIPGLKSEATQKILDPVSDALRARILQAEQRLSANPNSAQDNAARIIAREKRLSNTLNDEPAEAAKVESAAKVLGILAEKVRTGQRAPLTGDELVNIAKMANSKIQGVSMDEVMRKGAGFTFDEVSGKRIAYVAADNLDPALKNFAKWYDSIRNDPSIPVSERAAIVNRYLVSIHAFSEANGRTSRIIMDYVLMERGLPPPMLEPASVNKFAVLNSTAFSAGGNEALVPLVTKAMMVSGP